MIRNRNSNCYDQNGNQRRRTVGGSTYTLTGVYPERSRRDAENRLVSVSGAATASFTYDADGNRIKSVVNGETTIFVGSLYEKKVVGSTTTHTKYYTFGGRRIAVRVAGTLSWLLSDHLGSTAVTADGVSGVRTAELWYKPWGESRGTPFGVTPTTYRFTGQREDASIGLYFYNARYYDPALGRFISADTIVPQPGNPQSLNRYSYAANNPLRFVDPLGHRECEGASNCNEPAPVLPAAPPPAPPPVPAPSLLCTASVAAQYQGPAYRAAPVYAPDDGWILKYRIYGDADLRLEYVHVSSYATRGALPVMVAGEYRTVYLFEDGATLVFDEPSLSFTVGEGLYAGSEWTPTGGRQTTVVIGLGGADLQLQQNQVMIGLVNPAGVGGGRIGAQFSAPGVRVLATSQAYLVEKGGAEALGKYTFGNAAMLEWEKWIPGSYINGAWVSGAGQAAAWANQWPIKVVP